MGRKGGGKKAFLKGVVAKPETEDIPAEPSAEKAPPAAPDAASDTHAAPQERNQATEQDSLPSFNLSLSEQQLETETRGQLTQRQKKVPRNYYLP